MEHKNPNGPKGNRNVNWKNGVSEYPNHYKLKKNRLVKFRQVNYKCEKCGEKVRYVHHKDGSKTNHSIKNLLALCQKCHNYFHPFRSSTIHTRTYGMNLTEMAEKFGGTPVRYHFMHKKGTLQDFLKRQNI